MPVNFPLHLMAGAEWNILDSTGRRVAVCYAGHPTGEATAEDINLAAFIVETVNAAPKGQYLVPAHKRVWVGPGNLEETGYIDPQPH